MPAYDVSLWDFLKYASKQQIANPKEEIFPLTERIEMTKRICDGLVYLNRERNMPHRDIKPRSVCQIYKFLDPFLSDILKPFLVTL